jgi:hypothetical protein
MPKKKDANNAAGSMGTVVLRPMLGHGFFFAVDKNA